MTVPEPADPAVPVAIWGSCVTRDAMEVAAGRLELLRYHARTSWVAQASTPYGEEVGSLEPLSPFGARTVAEDYQKTVVDELVRRQPRAVLIDLIDERFVLLRTGPSWWTMSDYVQATAMNERIRRSPASRTEFLDDRRLGLFEAAARTLAPRLAALLPDTAFVLHEATWATRVRGEERFPAGHEEKAAAMNQALEQHYQVLADAFGPRLLRLRPPQELVVADPEHVWKLAAFHYVPEYYEWLVDAVAGADLSAHTARVVPPWVPTATRHARPAGDQDAEPAPYRVGGRQAVAALRSIAVERVRALVPWSRGRRASS